MISGVSRKKFAAADAGSDQATPLILMVTASVDANAPFNLFRQIH